jgi:hypothetical protein
MKYMKYLIGSLMLVSLIGVGCISEQEVLVFPEHCPDVCAAVCAGDQEPDVPDDCPISMCACDGDLSGSELTKVSGVINVGRFAGTEMGCMFSENDKVGDRMKCNSGSVVMSIVGEGGKTFWLDGYTCDAVEYFIKESDGTSVDYEASNCTSEVVVGETYVIEGEFDERKDQWYVGKQQDELWLLNSVLEIE